MKRTIKSFTLIELLVVIVIIGILSGVIVISVTNYINDAKNTKIVAELSNLSKSFEGYSNYYVGSLCIEDTANNAAFLSYYGLSSYPKHPNYNNGTSLTTNDCYLYFSDGTNYSIRTPSVGNKGYLIQESRHPQTKPIQKTCDDGWIPFGNRCVMQYRASGKNNSTQAVDDCVNNICSIDSYTAVSTGQTPWVNIIQADAKNACESIGAHLMTNAEWMAIARDIEATSSNWEGVILSNGISHNLSNGNVIHRMITWNVLDETITRGEQYDNFSNGVNPVNGFHEYTEANLFTGEHISYSMAGPLGSYNSETNHVGALWIYPSKDSSSEMVFVRGGRHNLVETGIFSLLLDYSTSFQNSSQSFRCVK